MRIPSNWFHGISLETTIKPKKAAKRTNGRMDKKTNNNQRRWHIVFAADSDHTNNDCVTVLFFTLLLTKNEICHLSISTRVTLSSSEGFSSSLENDKKKRTMDVWREDWVNNVAVSFSIYFIGAQQQQQTETKLYSIKNAHTKHWWKRQLLLDKRFSENVFVATCDTLSIFAHVFNKRSPITRFCLHYFLKGVGMRPPWTLILMNFLCVEK